MQILQIQFNGKRLFCGSSTALQILVCNTNMPAVSKLKLCHLSQGLDRVSAGFLQGFCHMAGLRMVYAKPNTGMAVAEPC